MYERERESLNESSLKAEFKKKLKQRKNFFLFSKSFSAKFFGLQVKNRFKN